MAKLIVSRWCRDWVRGVRWGIGLLVLAGSVGPGQAQLDFRTITLEVDPSVSYVEVGYFPPTYTPGKTNRFRLVTSGVAYGDKVRLRTVGTFAVPTGVNAEGKTQWGPEEPQPVVAFLSGGINHPNQYYIASPPRDSGLPEYVTPPIERSGRSIPTDSAKDFLITPEGVTVCIPILGNFLGMLNAAPGTATRDEDGDFAVEIIPLEKTRPDFEAVLSRTNVTVGDVIGATLTVTNIGNVPAYGLRMGDSLGREVTYDSNMVATVSGPAPSGIASLAPGNSAEILYSFQAIGPGTNLWVFRMGHMICSGNEFFASMANLAQPLVIEPVIDLTMREPGLESFTEESLEAGMGNPNAPLAFVAEAEALGDLPEFEGKGLIADGVTRLLLRAEVRPDKLERFPNGVTVRATAKMVWGEIDGTPIEDRLEVLGEAGWAADGELTLTKDKPTGFVALGAINSDELRPAGGDVEVVILIDLQDDEGLALGRIRVPVRRPPIALIHGYNTDGNWGADFIKELTKTRDATFVRTARYGQGETTSTVTGWDASINTLWPLTNLVLLAQRAIEEAMEPVRGQWLFTRHDVVAHSQGGLLTRMLCSRNANQHIDKPFRNEENYFRGRFHRVVTVGSPHNGTRLLRYILRLNQNEGGSVPNWVGYGMVESNIAQEKFDPWGPQIRALNDPSPSSYWAPDSTAPFHLVRTLILGGRNFTASASECPGFYALMLTTPEDGQIVVGEGSDGVVDFSSMVAVGPGQSAPTNSYTVPRENEISHAYMEAPKIGEIFGATSGQAISPVVARHVIGALNQDTNVPAADRVFGSFQVPPLLDDAIRDGIDQFAFQFNFDIVQMKIDQGELLRGLAVGGDLEGLSLRQDFKLRVRQPEGRPVAGQVLWVAELHGTNGISGKGLQILQPTQNPLELTLRLAAQTYGDVVLQGMYETATGQRVIFESAKVGTVSPPGVTAVDFEVLPGNEARHPAGLAVPIQVWTRWSDGRVSRRFIDAANFTVTSSAPGVVEVTNPLAWRTRALGEATMTVSFEGKTKAVRWVVFDPNAAAVTRVALAIDKASPAGVAVSWPAGSGGFQVQISDALGSAANWRNATETPVAMGDRMVLTLPASETARFYRLQKQP